MPSIRSQRLSSSGVSTVNAIRSFVAGVLAVVFSNQEVISQSTVQESAIRLRGHATAIAREVAQKLEPARPAAMTISVEGSPLKTATENAFLEVFRDQGVQTSLAPNGKDPALLVLALEQSVAFRELQKGSFERLCRTVLEARLHAAMNSEVSFIGTFSRESVDTVTSREQPLAHENDASFIDQVLGPILLIAGSLAIVLLLFAVRS